MGFDYTAITIIGLRLRLRQLARSGVPDHTNCSEGSQFGNYCNACGDPIQIKLDKIEWQSWVNLNPQGYDIIPRLSVKGYSLCQSGDTNNPEEWIYLYCAISERSGPRLYNSDDRAKIPHSLEELVSMKNKMQTDLAETGLWNDDDFGIWTLMQISY